jgi:ABC-type polysaccharide/polyol phosphate transport system ATPase subunit
MIELSLNKVSKRYRIKSDVGSEKGANRLARRIRGLVNGRTDFWALRDVSFEVLTGESLGIIGHNGAGKSTILKLLSNITSPTSGEIVINGRLSALIEVGSGFHPELTGRENIFLNGSILGMSRREIQSKFDQIVEFAGVEQFVDMPVKRFSSGMYVRLGFSIAAHLDPDILLLDEVLAVGDASFQAKCLERVRNLKNSGVTIVFISHDLAAVEKICDRAILMEKGEIRCMGSTHEVIHAYEKSPTGGGMSMALEGSHDASIQKVSFFDRLGAPTSGFLPDESVTIKVELLCTSQVKDAVVSILFYTIEGQVAFELSTESSGPKLDLEIGKSTVEFTCESTGLRPGPYLVDVAVRRRGGVEAINVLFQAAIIRIDGMLKGRGMFTPPHRWGITRVSVETADNTVAQV